MSHHSPILPILAALILGGCAAVGPNYSVQKLSLPESWTVQTPTSNNAPSSADRTRNLAVWWRQLGDAQLDSFIDEALSASKDLRLAQARLRRARANRLQAAGAQYPSLTASAAATRSRNAAGTNTPSAGTQTLYDAGFDASWEIDVFGGTRRAVEAAEADLASSQASLNNVRVSLVAEIAQNYVDLRSTQRRLAIARNNLATQSETQQITEWRNQAGLASSRDVEQARANREQTRAGIPDLEASLTVAKNRLAVLLGRSPGALEARLAETKPLPDVPAVVASGIPADVLRQRPDLIAAERTLAAETARVGQRIAERFPSLSLGASFGWQAYSLGALGGSASLARSVAGTLAATLFDGGRLRSAVEIQNAIQEQALVSYERSVLNALEEVENALMAYASAHERIAARRAAYIAARSAADLSRQMVESGLADFQSLLDTERTRLAAEDDLAVAEATQLSSLIQLNKALGGGWESPADRWQLSAPSLPLQGEGQDGDGVCHHQSPRVRPHPHPNPPLEGEGGAPLDSAIGQTKPPQTSNFCSPLAEPGVFPI